jgi:hypothetical protein
MNEIVGDPIATKAEDSETKDSAFWQSFHKLRLST